MEIAFLGLGKMGQLLAGHALAGGHQLTVWNRSPGKADELVARGARLAATPRDAARGADVVVLMVFDAAAVRSVLFEGPSAAVTAMREGAIVLDASTTGPTEARAIAAELAGLGLRYVDAPVTGSTPVAEKAALGVLLGGSDSDVAEVLPLVALWGDEARIRHIGPVGAGQAMKVVMNLSLAMAIAGAGECLALAELLELDRAAALDVLGGGPFGFTLGQKRELIESRDFTEPTFTVAALAKDIRLAAALGAGGPSATGAGVAADRAVAEGRGDQDYSALAVTVPTAAVE